MRNLSIISMIVTLFVSLLLPLAFLVIQNGNVKLMQMQSYHSSTERAVGMVPELVDKFAAMFSKEKKAPAEDQTV